MTEPAPRPDKRSHGEDYPGTSAPSESPDPSKQPGAEDAPPPSERKTP